MCDGASSHNALRGGCFDHCFPYALAFGLHGLLLAGSGGAKQILVRTPCP